MDQGPSTGSEARFAARLRASAAPAATQVTAREPDVTSTSPAPRRPFRDNPRAILFNILLLLATLVGFLIIANRSARLAPDFLTEVVLYALSVADLTMLAALVFVLARNVIKLVVERRRALPFARFRAKLVAVLLGMTLVPALLVLIVGSELIRNSVDRWFNAPMDEVLASANRLASDYYHDRQVLVDEGAMRVARDLATIDLSKDDTASVRDVIAAEVRQGRLQMIEVYRIAKKDDGSSETRPLAETTAPTLPRGSDRTIADRLAARTMTGDAEPRVQETLEGGGELIRSAALIRPSREASPTGVVVASDYLSGDLATRARRMTRAYEDYTQLRVLKRPLAGVYLSFFLMVTLLILVGATWMGLYLAKRITKPVQLLAAAAREIGAGHLDHRVEPETVDEFGSLVEAFNSMASELASSRRRLERSTITLERKHVEVENRRRYMETILERIVTGVVSVDGAGRISTLNSAAVRLLGIDRTAIGELATDALARADLEPLASLMRGASRADGEPAGQELSIVRDGREMQLAAVATTLQDESGQSIGMVLVIDDVTPLIRAQKVAAWREIARRLAHEIKNPLTPIQLSADRLRRHFSSAPVPTRALVDECTQTIAGEVESLKSLVDEFSQFARMPPPRTGTDRSQPVVGRYAAPVQRTLQRGEDRLPLRRDDSARQDRSGANPAGRDQSGGQRARSDGPEGPHRSRNPARAD